MTVIDYDYSITIEEGNWKTIQTQKLNMMIDSIIISVSPNDVCELKINFSELKDLIVYNNRELRGNKYIPIRLACQDTENQLLLPAFAKMLINNKLNIVVGGKKGLKVNITIRGYQNAS